MSEDLLRPVVTVDGSRLFFKCMVGLSLRRRDQPHADLDGGDDLDPADRTAYVKTMIRNFLRLGPLRRPLPVPRLPRGLVPPPPWARRVAPPRRPRRARPRRPRALPAAVEVASITPPAERDDSPTEPAEVESKGVLACLESADRLLTSPLPAGLPPVVVLPSTPSTGLLDMLVDSTRAPRSDHLGAHPFFPAATLPTAPRRPRRGASSRPTRLVISV